MWSQLNVQILMWLENGPIGTTKMQDLFTLTQLQKVLHPEIIALEIQFLYPVIAHRPVFRPEWWFGKKPFYPGLYFIGCRSQSQTF